MHRGFFFKRIRKHRKQKKKKRNKVDTIYNWHSCFISILLKLYNTEQTVNKLVTVNLPFP